MRSVRLCMLVLGLLVGREIAEAAEPAGGLSPQSGPPKEKGARTGERSDVWERVFSWAASTTWAILESSSEVGPGGWD